MLSALFILISGFVALSATRDVSIEPVPLHNVALRYDSRYDRAVSLNRDYILELEDDRMLHSFRQGLLA